MDIQYTSQRAHPPKNQGVLFVVDSGESGGGLWPWAATDAVGSVGGEGDVAE